MTVVLWLIVAAALALLITVVAVEETRVHEAQRDARSWAKRVCTHGGTSFQTFDGDESMRGRH